MSMITVISKDSGIQGIAERPYTPAIVPSRLSISAKMTSVIKQLPIDRSGQKALIDARMAIFDRDASLLAEKVYTGDITIGQWEEKMRAMIREMHSSVAAIGKGGWTDMTQSDWGKLGAGVKKQYRYLHGFAEYIDENRETINLGSIQARARMYGEAAKGAAYVAATPLDIIEQLPWMPKDGSTECLVNCKCVWLLQVLKVTRKTQTVQATWKLTPAEHCSTCAERNNYKVIITVPSAIKVPAMIGGW